jgi:hypothetical protein
MSPNDTALKRLCRILLLASVGFAIGSAVVGAWLGFAGWTLVAMLLIVVGR